MSPNLKAFLDMIAYSEGTKGIGDDGYNVLVGGGLFNSYDDHPRKLVTIRPGLKSTAAGRYQILSKMYDAYKPICMVYDFSPKSQDAIAVQMIKERGALRDIEEGKIANAIDKVCKIWASLPGAGYGQHEHSLTRLTNAYTTAGGKLSYTA